MDKALLFLILISTFVWLKADETLQETTLAENDDQVLRRNSNAFLSSRQQRPPDIFSKIHNTIYKPRRAQFLASYCQDKSNQIRPPNPYLEHVCKRIKNLFTQYNGPISKRPMYLPSKNMVYQRPQFRPSLKQYGPQFPSKLKMSPIMLMLSHLINKFLKNPQSSMPMLLTEIELLIPSLSVSWNPPTINNNTERRETNGTMGK